MDTIHQYHTITNPEVVDSQQIGRYLLTSHCLGSGSFATVHLAMASGSASYKQVACKIIKRKKDQKMEKMMKEVRILTALNHVRSIAISKAISE